MRWAAYQATPSKRKAIVFDPIDIPERPAYAKNSSPVATARSASAEGAQDAVSEGGPLTDEALCEIADALFCAWMRRTRLMAVHNRGEVWLTDLGYSGKTRPCLSSAYLLRI